MAIYQAIQENIFVRSRTGHISQEEITHRVELEYRLFLSIDSSLYRPKVA